MTKASAPNPKRLLLQKIYTKAGGVFRRQLGELGRVRVNPRAAETELAKATSAIEGALRMGLEATGLPVVGVEQEVPAGAHWVISPLVSPRNALYARSPVCMAVAFIDKDGTCPIGAIMLPMEEICLIAEAGAGAVADGLGRLRCGGRIEADDSLAMVPWKTADVVSLDLLAKLDAKNIHTRKSGCMLADIVDVATGRADVAISTRINRLEALLANLVMAESAGFASDMQGKPLGPKSTTIVAANPKLHAQILKVVAK